MSEFGRNQAGGGLLPSVVHRYSSRKSNLSQKNSNRTDEKKNVSSSQARRTGMQLLSPLPTLETTRTKYSSTGANSNRTNKSTSRTSPRILEDSLSVQSNDQKKRLSLKNKGARRYSYTNQNYSTNDDAEQLAHASDIVDTNQTGSSSNGKQTNKHSDFLGSSSEIPQDSFSNLQKHSTHEYNDSNKVEITFPSSTQVIRQDSDENPSHHDISGPYLQTQLSTSVDSVIGSPTTDVQGSSSSVRSNRPSSAFQQPQTSGNDKCMNPIQTKQRQKYGKTGNSLSDIPRAPSRPEIGCFDTSWNDAIRQVLDMLQKENINVPIPQRLTSQNPRRRRFSTAAWATPDREISNEDSISQSRNTVNQTTKFRMNSARSGSSASTSGNDGSSLKHGYASFHAFPSSALADTSQGSIKSHTRAFSTGATHQLPPRQQKIQDDRHDSLEDLTETLAGVRQQQQTKKDKSNQYATQLTTSIADLLLLLRRYRIVLSQLPSLMTAARLEGNDPSIIHKSIVQLFCALSSTCKALITAHISKDSSENYDDEISFTQIYIIDKNRAQLIPLFVSSSFSPQSTRTYQTPVRSQQDITAALQGNTRERFPPINEDSASEASTSTMLPGIDGTFINNDALICITKLLEDSNMFTSTTKSSLIETKEQVQTQQQQDSTKQSINDSTIQSNMEELENQPTLLAKPSMIQSSPPSIQEMNNTSVTTSSVQEMKNSAKSQNSMPNTIPNVSSLTPSSSSSSSSSSSASPQKLATNMSPTVTSLSTTESTTAERKQRSLRYARTSVDMRFGMNQTTFKTPRPTDGHVFSFDTSTESESGEDKSKIRTKRQLKQIKEHELSEDESQTDNEASFGKAAPPIHYKYSARKTKHGRSWLIPNELQSSQIDMFLNVLSTSKGYFENQLKSEDITCSPTETTTVTPSIGPMRVASSKSKLNATPLSIATSYMADDSSSSECSETTRNGLALGSCMMIPMYDEDLGGTFAIFESTSYHTDKFSTSVYELITHICQMTAIAFRNAKLAISGGNARRQAHLLLQMVQSVFSGTDVRDIITRIIGVAYELLSADRVSVFLVDWTSKQLILTVSEDAAGLRIPLRKGIAGYVATNGTMVNIRDAYHDTRFDRGFDKKTGYRTKSILAMPIRTDSEKVMAVVQAINKKTAHGEIVPFQEADVDMLAAVTDTAGVTLHKARLLQEANLARMQNAALVDVVKIVRNPSIEDNMEIVLDRLTEVAYRLVPSTRIVLFVVDELKAELRGKMHLGIDWDVLENVSPNSGQVTGYTKELQPPSGPLINSSVYEQNDTMTGQRSVDGSVLSNSDRNSPLPMQQDGTSQATDMFVVSNTFTAHSMTTSEQSKLSTTQVNHSAVSTQTNASSELNKGQYSTIKESNSAASSSTTDEHIQSPSASVTHRSRVQEPALSPESALGSARPTYSLARSFSRRSSMSDVMSPPSGMHSTATFTNAASGTSGTSSGALLEHASFREIIVPLGCGIVGRTATEHAHSAVTAPIIKDHHFYDSKHDGEDLGELSNKGILCMPLRRPTRSNFGQGPSSKSSNQEKAVGVLQLVHKRDGTPYNTTDIQLLEAFAAEVAHVVAQHSYSLAYERALHGGTNAFSGSNATNRKDETNVQSFLTLFTRKTGTNDGITGHGRHGITRPPSHGPLSSQSRIGQRRASKSCTHDESYHPLSTRARLGSQESPFGRGKHTRYHRQPHNPRRRRASMNELLQGVGIAGFNGPEPLRSPSGIGPGRYKKYSSNSTENINEVEYESDTSTPDIPNSHLVHENMNHSATDSSIHVKRPVPGPPPGLPPQAPTLDVTTTTGLSTHSKNRESDASSYVSTGTMSASTVMHNKNGIVTATANSPTTQIHTPTDVTDTTNTKSIEMQQHTSSMRNQASIGKDQKSVDKDHTSVEKDQTSVGQHQYNESIIQTSLSDSEPDSANQHNTTNKNRDRIQSTDLQLMNKISDLSGISDVQSEQTESDETHKVRQPRMSRYRRKTGRTLSIHTNESQSVHQHSSPFRRKTNPYNGSPVSRPLSAGDCPNPPDATSTPALDTQSEQTIFMSTVATLASYQPDTDRGNHMIQWNFDVLEYSITELQTCVLDMFYATGLPQHFGIVSARLAAFVVDIANRYKPNNPYHNWHHAVSVMHASYVILQSCQSVRDALPPLERLALLLSAVCHDVDHSGVNNAFLTSTYDELALRYNDQSVLENHHAAIMFQVLRDERRGTNVMDMLSNIDFKHFRRLCIGSILATDMVHHMDMVTMLKSLPDDVNEAFGKNGIVTDDHDTASVGIETNDCAATRMKCKFSLIDIILHSSDLCNPILPNFTTVRSWAERICAEFSNQAKLEEEQGLEPAPFMQNLDTINAIAKNQLGFMDYVCKPLWEGLSAMVPELEEPVKNLNQNREHWLQVIQDTTEEQE